MNKEMLLIVDVVSNEKGLGKDVIFNALESAIASATKKHYEEDIDIRVSINRDTGEYKAFRRWEVFDIEEDDIEYPERQMSLNQAKGKNLSIQEDFCEEPIEGVGLDRIGAQTAKQVIMQKIREAERSRVVDAYKHRIGELVNGIVKSVERGGIILDLANNVEALIPRKDLIPNESLRPDDRVRAYLKEVRSEIHGPQLFLSRTAPELLIELFKLEVPEIGENLIEVIAAARDPGVRAKIAVKSNDARIDPVGSCVGMRGSRVQAVSNELSGERIDIVLWHESPAQFVINAIAPADVSSVIVDEDSRSMDIAVQEDQLAQAIGRNGQNVRLASQVTGWTLNVMTESQAREKKDKQDSEKENLVKLFVSQLNVDEETANILVDEGFVTLEEVAYIPITEMAKIDGFDKSIAKELRERAKDALIAYEIANEEQFVESEIDSVESEEGNDAPPLKLDRDEKNTDIAEEIDIAKENTDFRDSESENLKTESGGLTIHTVDSKIEPAEDLLAMEGMDDELAYRLAKQGIITMNDLAEQATDDLVEFLDISKSRAGKLIMTARAPWFFDK